MANMSQRSNTSVKDLITRYEELSNNTSNIATLNSSSEGHIYRPKSRYIVQQSSDISKSTSSVITQPQLFWKNELIKKTLKKNANPKEPSSLDNQPGNIGLQNNTAHLQSKKVTNYEELRNYKKDVAPMKLTSDRQNYLSNSHYIKHQSSERSHSISKGNSPKLADKNEHCIEVEKNANPDDYSKHYSQGNVELSNDNKEIGPETINKIKIAKRLSRVSSNTKARSQRPNQLSFISETSSPPNLVRKTSRKNETKEPSEIKALSQLYVEENTHLAEYVSDSCQGSSPMNGNFTSLNVKNSSNVTVQLIAGSCVGGELSPIEKFRSTSDSSKIPNRSTSTHRHGGFESISDTTRERIQTHPCISRTFKNKSNRFQEAKNILDKNGFLIITCNPGDGSTHLGLELLTAYKGYSQDCVKEAGDMKDIFKRKSIVMLDDACGRTPLSFSESEVCELRKIIEIHRGDFVNKKIKLIIIIKNSIKDNCKELLEDHEKKILNFSNQSFQLNVDEKKYIITQCIKYKNHDNDKPIHIHCTEPETHLNDESIPNISETTTTDAITISEDTLLDIATKALSTGFPKQVHNFLSDEHNMLQGINYFLDPSATLQDQINAIANTDNYVALIAVLANNSKELDQDTIDTLSDRFDEQNQTLESSCYIIRDVFKKQNRNVSLRECVHNGVQASLGTYLREIRTNTFTFSAKAVETAIMLSLAKEFKPYILRELDDRLFNKFVVTDLAPADLIKSKSRICIKRDEKSIVKFVIERLKIIAMTGNLHSLAAHPLMRDKLFAQMFFDNIKKEPKCTRKLYYMKDSITHKQLISYGLDYTFINVTSKDTICNISVMILLSEKWSKIRKEPAIYKWVREQEYPVIDHCFRYGFFGSFIALIDKLNTSNTQTYKYLIESVEHGMQSFLVEILRLDAKKKMFDNRDLHDVAITALETYLKDPKDDNLFIIETISHNMPSDCKVDCPDAVLFAGKIGNIRLLESLKRLNANINVVNESKKTCIHLATINNHEDFVASALRYYNADQLQYDKIGYMAIHYATENDCENIVQILYNHDNNVLHKPNQKQVMQPLHIAALNNNTKTAAFLIEHDVNIHARDKDLMTPIHYAAKSGKCGVMWLLLQANVDIIVKDKHSITPLHYAAKFGNSEGICMLLKADVDVDAQDCTSKTPLHYAIIFEKCAMTRMLLNAHVDINAKDDTLKTPLHYAVLSENCEIIQLLLKANENSTSLVENNIDIDAKDIELKTPLHYAIISGKYAITRLLLNAHEDINNKDDT